MTTKPTRQNFPIFESIGQCAAVLNVPVSIIRAAKRQGCKAFLPGNRIDSGILITYLLGSMAEVAGIAETRETAMTRKLTAEAVRLERQNKLDAGETISISDATEIFGKKIAALVQGLDQLPALVPGLSFEQRSILVAEIEKRKAQAREAR